MPLNELMIHGRNSKQSKLYFCSKKKQSEKVFHVLTETQSPGPTARTSYILQALATESTGVKFSDLQNAPSFTPQFPATRYGILCPSLIKPLVHASHRDHRQLYERFHMLGNWLPFLMSTDRKDMYTAKMPGLHSSFCRTCTTF